MLKQSWSTVSPHPEKLGKKKREKKKKRKCNVVCHLAMELGTFKDYRMLWYHKVSPKEV